MPPRYKFPNGAPTQQGSYIHRHRNGMFFTAGQVNDMTTAGTWAPWAAPAAPARKPPVSAPVTPMRPMPAVPMPPRAAAAGAAAAAAAALPPAPPPAPPPPPPPAHRRAGVPTSQQDYEERVASAIGAAVDPATIAAPNYAMGLGRRKGRGHVVSHVVGYTMDGSPIHNRAQAGAGQMRLAVVPMSSVQHGYGIAPINPVRDGRMYKTLM